MCLPARADLELNQGWNLISINILPDDTNIETMLESISDKVEAVWAYNHGQWDFYSAADPEFTDLYNLVPGTGYWIKLSSDAVLITQGDAVNLSNCLIIIFETGWNLTGYNSQTIKTPSEAFASIIGSIVSVWAFVDGEWLLYDPLHPDTSTLTEIRPGSGYWIKTNGPCIWAQ